MNISVLEIIEKDKAISVVDGEKLFKYLKKHLQKDESINVSFKGIKMVISAFLNTAIGKLYRDFTKDTINSKLHIDNLKSDSQSLLKEIQDYAPKYYKNRKKYNKIENSTLAHL